MTPDDDGRTALLLGRVIVGLLIVLLAGGVLFWLTMPA
jgi:hypothetical protein